MEKKMVWDWLRLKTPKAMFMNNLKAACKANEWTLHNPTSESVHLILKDNTHLFLLGIFRDGDQAVIVGYSHGEFAVNRFPPVLRKGLETRNKQLDSIEWWVIDGPVCSQAIVRTRIMVQAIDGPRLDKVVEMVLDEVKRFDAGLRRYGLLGPGGTL